MNDFNHDEKYESLNGILAGLVHHVYLNVKGYYIDEKDSYDHGNNAPTVLLTQGLTCTPTTMHLLGEYLKEYFNVAYAPRFPKFNTVAADLSAKMLEQKIREVLTHEKNKDINLIGHSFGGILSIEAVRIATDVRVNNIITLSTPYVGPPLSELFKNVFPACKNLVTRGGFHGKTNIEKQIQGKLIAHISEMDSVVSSYSQTPNSCIARNKTRIVRHSDWDHGDFIIGNTCKRTSELIHEEIHKLWQ